MIRAPLSRCVVHWMMPILLLGLCAAGCKNDDMADQPKLNPYEPTPVFADGIEARPLVGGTIARPASSIRDSRDGATGISSPPSVDAQLIRRGQERFNIYCSVCHGRLGDGNGMIVQRGMIRPPSFHNDRLSDVTKTPDSHFYDVISNGRGAMFSYAERVAPADRWAIAAYIRTLQESVRQSAKNGTLSAAELTALKGVRP